MIFLISSPPPFFLKTYSTMMLLDIGIAWEMPAPQKSAEIILPFGQQRFPLNINSLTTVLITEET